ncbi:lipase family protein [Sorangium sp. So ce134]
MLRRSGFDARYCRHIRVANDAMFVVANAFFVRSACGRMGILCFRGTEPANIISWLTDASASGVPWRNIGQLHGGFHRNADAAFRDILEHLREAMRAAPADARGAASRGDPGAAPGANALAGLEALYITGHSLGGAMAVVTAAMMFEDETCQDLRGVLRGIYTFGQPMICDPALASHWQRQFGSIVFRHVFSDDIVPRLPPRTMGEFAHLGHEYVDQNGTWVLEGPHSSRQACSALASNLIGLTAWLLRQFKVTQDIELPFSWEEHSPMHYIATSRLRDLRPTIG